LTLLPGAFAFLPSTTPDLKMSDKLKEWYTCFVCYTLTASTFTKRNLDDSERKKRKDGSLITRSWDVERIKNEAAALRLVQTETSIPVPEVLEVGEDNLGRAYLKTERIPGISLEEIIDQCRFPLTKRHVNNGPCEECSSIAERNAEQFIKERVFPQLRRLRSSTTGLNDFVIPPPWILEYDKRQHWDPKATTHSSYSFCHGDLSPANIIMDPETLEVNGIIDWEHAGYFPPALEVYAVNIKSYMELYKNEERIQKLTALINP
jgi:tRNA A-37 threonylcarbamoyl transferase component Bud32